MVKVEGTLAELSELFNNVDSVRRTKQSVKRVKTGAKVTKAVAKKGKQKLSSYNKFMKTELSKLKKAHPRMKQPARMKKAAAAWRKKKRGRK